MRLNSIAPKDDPMYESMFCFGGGGSDSGGGSADDADSMDSGYDTSSVGMGTNTMGSDGSNFGRGDSGGGNDRNDDPMGMADLAAQAAAASPNANVAAANAALSDMDRGSGGDGGAAAGPALIDSYLDGPMLADISTPMTRGDFVDPTTGRGVMADISAVDYGALGGYDPSAAGQDTGSLLGQVAPEAAGGERFDYSDQDIFGDLTDEQLQQQAYVAGLQAGPSAAITSQVQAPPTIISQPEFIQPGGPGTRGLALAVDDLAQRGVDVAQDYMDALQAANRERIASGGTRDVSTTISTTDMLDPFGDGLMSDEERARSNAEIAATDARIAALRGATPVEQITAQARQPVDMSPQQGRVVSETVLGAAPESRTAAPGTYTGVGSLQYAPTPARDPVGESIDRAITDFANYREGQTRTQTPDGVEVDDFMLTRDLVSQPPAYGAAYSPLEQLRMQEGTRTVPAVNVPDVEVFGTKIPTSIAGRIASDVLTPASAVDRALQAGATPIYDAQGRIEGAVDKYGTVYDASPYDFESSEAMKAAYAEQSRRQEAERGDGDGGGQQILPPPAPAEPIAGPAEPYQGRDIVGEYNYQPRGPISYAYTGLPSLAPTTLRPSFQARGQYAPLFPMRRA